MAEFHMMSDQQLNEVDEQFNQVSELGLTQESSAGAGDGTMVNLSNFAALQEAAGETGDRWTARISYEMASWTESAGDNNSSGGSTMGGLLKTSISLQEGNMEFQITKGVVDAAASKAASTAADIGRSAKGQ